MANKLDGLTDLFMCWSDDITQDEFRRLVKWCGGSEGPLKKRIADDILKEREAYALFEKLKERGDISTQDPGLLITLFGKIQRTDLVDQVKVRYALGFDNDVSDEDLKKWVKIWNGKGKPEGTQWIQGGMR
ncbi:uncharacterized protein LOC144434510 isoform X2 [Glandiceps talaboti]